jgi:acetyl-CoA carboxylase carboxyl transferase subunit alpha
MSRLRVPVVAVVIGEGGSGGALALGVADRLLMLENAIYSVISPEGCAAILWKTADAKHEAAEALKLTAADLVRLGVADEVVPEPLGGAQTDLEMSAAALKDALVRNLEELDGVDAEELVRKRLEKYLSMGEWRTGRRKRG